MLHPLLENVGSLRSTYEQIDWARTPVGPMDQWSPAMRSTLSLALNSRFAVALLWSSEFTLIYNEAYAAMIADKHPSALGRPAAEVFPEAWDAIGPMLQSVVTTNNAVWQENISMPLWRNGACKEAFFTFSYSPVINNHGDFEGLLDIATETTDQVISLRRLALLSRARQLATEVEDPTELPLKVAKLLRGYTPDLADIDIVLPSAYASVDDRPAFWDTAPATIAEGDVLLIADEEVRTAWLRLPGATPARLRPLMVVQLSEYLRFDDSYEDFLQLIADALGVAWDRVVARKEEQAHMQAVASMSETLQRSLLTEPPVLDDVEIAVRYVPSAQEAQIGGDWYDAFVDAKGKAWLVIGDVAGHDQYAAAGMGQMRNLLRGIGYTLAESPASVLAATDEALRGLARGSLATAVVATIEADGGPMNVRWSNAGHPPPVLVGRDGVATLLREPANLLLGVAPESVRHDHVRALESGATLLFYTDGLVERRSAMIEESLEELRRATEASAALPIEQFCDAILDAMGMNVEDDVALLAVRPRQAFSV